MEVKREGFENGRFKQTRTITVELFDRCLNNGTDPANNVWSNWIKRRVSDELNINIEWVKVPRWSEEEELPKLLAAGAAPDVCVTYNHEAITQSWLSGGVLDLAPYFEDMRELFPNVWNLVGERNMYAFRNISTGQFYAIEGVRSDNGARINTFAREDWLKKLDIPEPKTLDEFERMLIIFNENRARLLPDKPGALVPFSLDRDVAWRANNLLVSFVPDAVSDKDLFIYGADDRNFLCPGIKEGVRVLNKWYNMGLIRQDFHKLEQFNAIEDNDIMAGNVGSFMHNWDYPYRNGYNGIYAQLIASSGEDAVFTAVDPFMNNAGKYRKFTHDKFDRKLFFPATNKEPLASALYIDWISRPDVIRYLQIGEEGITHATRQDGAIEILDNSGNKYMQNSFFNLDYTITNNGLNLGDSLTTSSSLAVAYETVPLRHITKAYMTALRDNRTIYVFNVGGLSVLDRNLLAKKRDETLIACVSAAPDDFDEVFDKGMREYLELGGQMSIDERTEGFNRVYDI